MRNQILAACALLLCLPSAAMAAEPKLISTHGKWSAYMFVENGNKVCYIASEPVKDEGAYARRGQIYALITNRPAEGSKNVFSYIAGYPYKPATDATVKINDTVFTLFTQDDTAWAPDAATDEKITEALRKGSSLIVKGTSARGTPTVDTFSLDGSGSAHDAMTKECAAQ